MIVISLFRRMVKIYCGLIFFRLVASTKLQSMPLLQDVVTATSVPISNDIARDDIPIVSIPLTLYEYLYRVYILYIVFYTALEFLQRFLLELLLTAHWDITTLFLHFVSFHASVSFFWAHDYFTAFTSIFTVLLFCLSLQLGIIHN